MAKSYVTITVFDANYNDDLIIDSQYLFIEKDQDIVYKKAKAKFIKLVEDINGPTDGKLMDIYIEDGGCDLYNGMHISIAWPVINTWLFDCRNVYW